jgi:hypothetical protein
MSSRPPPSVVSAKTIHGPSLSGPTQTNRRTRTSSPADEERNSKRVATAWRRSRPLIRMRPKRSPQNSIDKSIGSEAPPSSAKCEYVAAPRPDRSSPPRIFDPALTCNSRHLAGPIQARPGMRAASGPPPVLPTRSSSMINCRHQLLEILNWRRRAAFCDRQDCRARSPVFRYWRRRSSRMTCVASWHKSPVRAHMTGERDTPRESRSRDALDYYGFKNFAANPAKLEPGLGELQKIPLVSIASERDGCV